MEVKWNSSLTKEKSAIITIYNKHDDVLSIISNSWKLFRPTDRKALKNLSKESQDQSEQAIYCEINYCKIWFSGHATQTLHYKFVN